MHVKIEKSSSLSSSSTLSSPQYHPQPQHYENAVDNMVEDVDHDHDHHHHHDGPINRIIPKTTTTTTTTTATGSKMMIANSNNGGGKATVIVIFIISVIMIFNSILLLYQYHLSTITFVIDDMSNTNATIATTTTTITSINATNIIQTLQSSTTSSTSRISMIPTLTSWTLQQQQQHCSSSMSMMNEEDDDDDDETMQLSSSSSLQSPNHHKRRIIHETMDDTTSMKPDQEEDEEDTNHTKTMSMTTNMSSSSSSSSSPSSTIFLWHVSIEMSMTIITNLIHAALLLVVGIIVYIRYDIIWMLYMYHTTFYWMIITFSSLIVYSQSIFDSTISSTLLYYIQYCTIWLFGICTTMVWYRYHPTYRITFQNAWNQPQPHNITTTGSTTTLAIRIIYYGCQCLQYGMICYYCSTTLQYLYYETYNNTNNNDDNCHRDRTLHDVSDHNDEMTMLSSLDDANITGTANTMPMTSSSSSIDMNDFVMSYSEVAHLTFILSQLQLSIVYPYSNPCCIGAALVAGWKLLLNTISLYSLVQSISSLSSWTIRTKLSLFYTIYDILIMIPILFAALYLYYSNGSNLSSVRAGKGSRTKWTRLDDTASTTDHSGSSMASMNDDTKFVAYGVVTATTVLNDVDNDDDDDDDDNSHIEDGLMKVDINTTTKNQPIINDDIDGSSSPVSTFECRTSFQIASSSSSSLLTKQTHIYSWRQQYGAKLLSYGSLLLLIGMSLESIVLQSQSFLFVNHAKYDLYKWGLHLCVMFTFCTVMCMNVGVTYYEQYSRPILLLACPAGSLIAAYQYYNLWYGSSSNKDIMSFVVMLLFLIRCICGIMQTVGVYLLNSIQQQPQQYHCATTVSVTSSSDNDDEDEDGNSSHASDEEELHVIDIDDGTTTTTNQPISLMTVQSQQQLSRQIQLHELHTRINTLFYYIFIPIMIVYIAMSVSGYHHNHNSPDNDDSNNGMCLIEPNISPMIPSTMSNNMSSSCSDNDNNSKSNNMEGDGFMLMPNIPGLGLYFHFGLVLLLFIYDGIQRTVPTYTPSLFLATISTYHLAILLATDILLWDVIQTQFYTTISFSNIEIVQRIIQLLWSMIAGYLAYSLHQFWNVRVTALHE